VTKSKGFVGTKSVEPNRTVCTHNYHAVKYDWDHQIPRKVPEEKKKAEWQHARKHKKADK